MMGPTGYRTVLRKTAHGFLHGPGQPETLKKAGVQVTELHSEAEYRDPEGHRPSWGAYSTTDQDLNVGLLTEPLEETPQGLLPLPLDQELAGPLAEDLLVVPPLPLRDQLDQMPA